jgi:hypothetical protein
MTKCPKCGAEIKYIPMGFISAPGVAVVEPEYTETIGDNGRILKGYLWHRCPKPIKIGPVPLAPISLLENGE